MLGIVENQAIQVIDSMSGKLAWLDQVEGVQNLSIHGFRCDLIYVLPEVY